MVWHFKIEGDGAPITRHSNFCLLMIVLVDKHETVFSARGREILCAVNGKETADLWKVCMGDVVRQLNSIISSAGSTFAMNSEGTDNVNVEFFLGEAMYS